MPRKEKLNAKSWERDRRNRMNVYFKDLSDLLPPLLEGRKRNKIDILIHAAKHIRDLQNRTEELFGSQATDAQQEELVRLKKLVTQLIARSDLLSELLKNAGITVPEEPALEKITPLKWSNKINIVSESKTDIHEKVNKSKKKKKVLAAPAEKDDVQADIVAKEAAQDKHSNDNIGVTVENQENHTVCKSGEATVKKKTLTSTEDITECHEFTEAQPPKIEIKNHKSVKRKTQPLQTNSFSSITNINTLPAGQAKHQICSSDKQRHYTGVNVTSSGHLQKRSSTSGGRRKQETAQNTFDFSALEDFHPSPTTFFAPPPPPNPMYQNQSNIKPNIAPVVPAIAPPVTVSSNVGNGTGGGAAVANVAASGTMAHQQQHHASGTSLANFHLTTIFPEMNDKVPGYKSSTSHTSTNYSQRSNYADPLRQMPQVSESVTHFSNTGPR
ncbi:hypothetical protein QAD02_001229 [Eretmocerus hayati]|uniref:Uncharacterized protein n=1 Tax=Eretmocerus hayati TaxID=131215 RepID=A0ACC2NFJ8_9HYME|nr:hypothetical protein QAD02_001229 [Eretmocerus hayati]